mgnify:FL=1
MDRVTDAIAAINGVVWGVPMLIAILGTGLFLTIGLRAMPVRKLAFAFGMLAEKPGASGEKGEISPFSALMTALSATVGTGNIAGVATAITFGGPGAVFWMWMTALVGMATKYAEGVLAVEYRQTDAAGRYVGGPMYYIRHGLGPRWLWLAGAFAVFGAVAGFGIGNTVQANSVADALQSEFSISPRISGVVLAALVAAVIFGGLKRIALVAGRLVPLMAVAYIAAGLLIVLLNAPEVPGAFAKIFAHAFSPIAATGGFAGAAVAAAIQFGVARGVFSNEAGLGSAPIAHAAARTSSPVRQGTVAMLGTFIDTLVVCTITALAILTTGAWTEGLDGAALTAGAFERGLPGVGGALVSVALALFAFSTLLGWSYYGERCVAFLGGVRTIWVFRALWVAAVPTGALLALDFVWLIADTMNAMMALPNLIGLLLLSPVVFRLTRAYFSRGKG